MIPLPRCESEAARAESARRGLELIGAQVARTAGRPSPVPSGVCPECWAHGKYIPQRTLGACLGCDARAAARWAARIPVPLFGEDGRRIHPAAT